MPFETKRRVVAPSVPVTDADFQHPDHWGHAWWSASEEWGLTMACTVEVGWFLYGLVRAYQPSLCVETGTHRGLSSLFIGAALRDNDHGRLVTIDIQDHGQAERIKARGLGEEWVTCRIQPSHTYEPDDTVDFLFLDAAHGYEPVAKELLHFRPHLSFGAIIAIDDSRIVPDEQAVAANFKRLYSPWGFQLLTSRGMYLLKYLEGIEKDDDTCLEYYRTLHNWLLPERAEK